MTEPRKYPAPQGNPETTPFWEAARQGKFMIKRCTACGEPHYFPRSICPFCFSDKTVWEESSGEATIYTFSLMRKSATGPYATIFLAVRALSAILSLPGGLVFLGYRSEVIEYTSEVPDATERS